MIRNILFDMGGVVYHSSQVEARRRFRAAGIRPEDFMRPEGYTGMFRDLEAGDITGEEFCREMARAAGRDNVSWQEAQHCWMGFLIEVPRRNLDALLRLREQYHVCLLTNINPFIMQYTRSNEFSGDGHPIGHYFDSVFCSYELHAFKPHRDFFEKVLAADGMKPEECIFIDDREENVRGAEALGIHGLHIEANADWIAPLSEALRARGADDVGAS